LWKWIGAILIFLAAVITAVVLLDITDVIPAKEMLIKQLKAIPVVAPHAKIYDLGQKKSAELESRMDLLAEKERLLVREQERLDEEQERLKAWQQSLAVKEEDISRTMKRLEQKEEDLRRWEERQRDIENLWDVYEELEAGVAAKTLSLLDIEVAARILSGVPAGQTAAILGAMPPEFAAGLIKAMGGGDSPAGAGLPVTSEESR